VTGSATTSSSPAGMSTPGAPGGGPAEALYARAVRVLPGGVTASARLLPDSGRPFYLARGEGAYVYDLEGRRYLDGLNSHGATLLGHGHPAVAGAVRRVLELGTLCAAEHPLQVELAERLAGIVPCAEQVRFTTSGTETTWHAVRVARGYTGRAHVLRFEGHFHGFNDTLAFSSEPPLERAGPADAPHAVVESAGVPPEAGSHVTVVPFNDAGALERAVLAHRDDLAAVILEPINYDCYGILPRPGFLEALRDLTRRAGAVLIFDEILSGFRTGPGGAQTHFGVTPDLCTLGKALGGGMPLSAFAGRAEVMQAVSPVGGVVHSGTYNAHLSGVAAALAFLDEIAAPGFYPALLATGERLYAGLREVFARRGLPVWVQGVGCRFGLLFGLEAAPQNYRQAAARDRATERRFLRACVERGLYFHTGSPHHGYTAAHTAEDVAAMLQIADDAARAVAAGA
jgi:glutamate-1-semialdehyde 2,1-aminomutase